MLDFLYPVRTKPIVGEIQKRRWFYLKVYVNTFGLITLKEQQGLSCLPISQAYPLKENRFILKGWGDQLRVLEWNFSVSIDLIS